ncbi:MAG: hypothetical protein GY878_15470 [Fuerstiella sp.]|nr:hypothetical protein [Fuerstiella sp.]
MSLTATVEPNAEFATESPSVPPLIKMLDRLVCEPASALSSRTAPVPPAPVILRLLSVVVPVRFCRKMDPPTAFVLVMFVSVELFAFSTMSCPPTPEKITLSIVVDVDGVITMPSPVVF